MDCSVQECCDRKIYIINSDNVIINGDNMNLELKIVGLLMRNKGKRFTINEIALNLGEFYSFVHRIVNKLSDEDVIGMEKAGRSYLCSLNADSEKMRALAQLSEIERKSEICKDKELCLVLDDFISSARGKDLYSAILFGSYAKGTATKKSDIDILLVCMPGLKADKAAKDIYAKYGREISPVIMSPDDFMKQKDDALIKDIVKSHYVLYGAEKFVNMVFG